jgi:ABC-type transport system substrate-binding protein
VESQLNRTALVIAACLSLDAGVHAETRPRYGGTVEATLLGAPGTLDPAEVRTHAELTVCGLVLDTLYRVGADGIVMPHLAAAEPTYDEKRTTAFIPIRKGVRMHDGSELTPADVAASLQRERSGARWLLAGLTSVKADGDGIVISLRAPQPELTLQLAAPQLAITKAGRAGERPIGTGAYAIDALDRSRKKLTLRAFDDHFAGRPYVDVLVLTWYDTPDGEARRFETGKSHVSARGATAFAGGKPTFRTVDVEGPPALLVYVGFGTSHRDVLADRSFRRALDLSLARGGLAAITSGERVIPTRMPVPVEAGGLALDAKGRASDIDAARSALADAQKRVPALVEAKLAALRLEILVEETRPDDREIAERVVLALDKLGIGAVITALPATALRDRIAKGTYDLTIGQLAQPVTSSALWWGAAFQAGGDDTLQSQLAAGAIDAAAASKELSARLPILPLMFRSVRMWFPTNVRGLALDAFGRPSYAEVSLFGAPIPAAKGKTP